MYAAHLRNNLRALREELGRRRADDFRDLDHHAAGWVHADKAALAPGMIAQGIDDPQARLLVAGCTGAVSQEGCPMPPVQAAPGSGVCGPWR